MKLNKRTIDQTIEEEYTRVERAERGELDARERAWRNAWIDEQRLRDAAADEAYWEAQCELDDQRRQDQ
jgi:hypothetical protein